ncbi:glycerophosphodiester phosphodiesterase family protein [Plastorhodobacter daqingensis]|uniref:Glycerophosphodiester phosphodiesterase family protein n=1 Tax=Plastorhodobacter daqingensis TaxID=1387281 RepID=A0ABW2UHB3_9RHOB
MPRLPQGFLNRPIAHRALHDKADGRPENSLAAVRAAVAAGYGIEIDLQISSDGEAMVFHDYTLSRLTQAKGPLRARTAAELGTIRLRDSDETIPTLAQVLKTVAGKVPLLIEIKDQDGALGPNVGRLEAATARALERYEGPVALMSFNPHAVAEMQRLCPQRPRGLTTSAYRPEHWALVPAETRDRLRDIPDYERTGACFISHEWRDLDRPRVQQLRDAGAAILCWTIRSPEAEQEARRIAQNITFEGYAAAQS